MVDRHGKRAALLVICGISITGVHLTLGCTDLFPVFPMLVLGVSYSIYGVSIWPSVSEFFCLGARAISFFLAIRS